MMVKESYIRPLLLKFGVALAVSFAGYLCCRLRIRRIKPSQPPPDYGNEVNLGGRAATVPQGDLPELQTEPSACNELPVGAERNVRLKQILEDKCVHKETIPCCVDEISPRSKCNTDKDGLLLSEFHDLVKEINSTSPSSTISLRTSLDNLESNFETSKLFQNTEEEDWELEMKSLQNKVRVLTEREKQLEFQLLEYYGLKEQETIVMELQNRLKINNVEAKLFNLKIESLQTDKRRLESEVAHCEKVKAELEVARFKIKMLKKKLRSESEQHKEQLLTLKQKVSKLQDHEHVGAQDIKLKLHKLKDFEEEAEELKRMNANLQDENCELARRLESMQVLASSVLEESEAESLRETIQHLRQENNDLSAQIERLKSDRCADVEELVYLRWVNACLRYELRNYHPLPKQTVARDLSKTLSPKSEEKAKQLLLEYASTEFPDLDSDRWSSSCLTDSGEFDDSFSIDNSSATRTNGSTKSKIFKKLRRLIRGKASPNAASLEGFEGRTSNITSVSRSSPRSSLDVRRSRSLSMDYKDLGSFRRSRSSDVGSSYRRLVLGDEIVSDSHMEPHNAEDVKDSRHESSKLHRKSASCSYSSF